MADDFDTIWAAIADVPPIAHELKFELPSRWLRIHSLPNAKRYAETADEHQQVLTRASTVLTQVAGRNQEAVLVTALWGDKLQQPPPSAQQEEIHSTPEYWRAVESGEDSALHLWASTENHLDAVTSRLISMTAAFELAEVLVLLPGTRTAVHPYDGGIDVIAPTPSKRDERFSDWLSPLESGL